MRFCLLLSHQVFELPLVSFVLFIFLGHLFLDAVTDCLPVSLLCLSLSVMDEHSNNKSFVQSLRDVDGFVGTCLVKNLCGLVEGSDCGVFVVPASFEGVEEGVDMWFPDNGLKVLPRYVFCI